MIKAFTPAEWSELRMQFDERRDKQLLLMEAHESAGSYGMAYLALWATMEFFAKRLGPVAQRQELKAALSGWLAYLNATSTEPPKKIGIGKYDIPKKICATIPPESSLQLLFPLSAGPSFYLVIATKSKYRNRRNDIAHNGDTTSINVYEDFKEVSLTALSEIQGWLSGGVG
jgi:hypothetical protein